MTAERGRLKNGAGRFVREWTVQGWFNATLTILAVLICAGAVTTGVLLTRTGQITDDLIETLLPAKSAALQLQTSLINQETGVRGYALTSSSTFLEPYDQGVQTQRQAETTLRALTGNSPEFVTDLAAIDRGYDRWRAMFADPILAATPGDAVRSDPSIYDRGKSVMDRLRGDFAVQNRHLDQARVDAQRHLSTMRTARNAVVAALFVVLLAAAGLFALLIRVTVIRPLRRVAESSRRVAQGEFAREVDAGRGPSDIRALAEDIEGMRRRIVNELDVATDRQRQLEEQAVRLDAQTVELRRSNAELEQFAYVTSHDLQEPLRKVASFCQLLEKRYGDVLDERAHQYIDFAVDGAKRMQTLINDVLTFSRVGRVGDRFAMVSLDTSLEKALADLSLAVEESQTRPTRPPHLPTVEGDPLLLAMLWQNLIGNAIKFAREDTVPEVMVSARRDTHGHWLISVQDNGIGISSEFADKVFVIFQRLHGRDAYTGTGIGLALCKKIVEYHGGTIWIDTDHASGTRICFTLPAAPDQTETDDDPATTEGVTT